MGSLYKWPLKAIVVGLARQFAIHDFVETGTYRGHGCAWATDVFSSVTTIEKCANYRDAALASYAHLPIRFLLGDSADILPGVVPELSGPALFWLDGHAGGGNFGPDDDCPLIKELAAISSSMHNHFIIIDDARAFVAPPPPPFVAARWPNICEVLDAARLAHEKFCVVIADAIICVPPNAQAQISQFCNEIRPTI